MKIFNDEKKVIFNGALDFSKLDIDNVMNDSQWICVPLNDENIKKEIGMTLFTLITQRGWSGLDDEKTKLFIDISTENEKIKISLSAYMVPWYTPLDEIMKETNEADRQGLLAGFEEVQDFINEGNAEIDYLDIELDAEEKATLLESVLTYAL